MGRKQDKAQLQKTTSKRRSTEELAEYVDLSESSFYAERREVPDITLPFFYTTHTLTCLFVSTCVVFYFGDIFATNPEASHAERAKLGIYACIFLFLMIGAQMFPAGPFIRPHPQFWRLAFGGSVLYLLATTYLLMLTPKQVKATVHSLNPNWGNDIVMKSYCNDCTLTYESFMDKCDRFVIAHIAGWLFKSMLLRDRVILWSLSAFWELLELSLYFYVPNFAECWWDQWVLDFLLSNGIGIELGLLINSYLEEKEYIWSGLLQTQTICGKFQRVIMQFTPESYDKIEWEPQKSINRYFFTLLAPVIFVMPTELNAFFLKLNLGITTEDSFNIWRMLAMSVWAWPATRQYYLYLVDPKCTRLGSQAWVYIMIGIVESLLCYKTADPLPPVPWENKVAWAIGATVFFLLSYLLMTRRRIDDTEQRQKLAQLEKTVLEVEKQKAS